MPVWCTGSDGAGYWVEDHTAMWVTSTATASSTTAWNDPWMGQTSTATTSQYMQAAMIQQQCINTMMAQQAVWTDQCNNIYQSDLGQRAPRVPMPREPTPAEAAETRALDDRRKAAGKKAEELLLSHLTAEQRETFVKGRWFVVKGKTHQYRINGKTYAGNIEILEGDKVVARLCCHCRPDIPLHDHLLAQKIMLESAEDDFIKLANRRSV